MHQFVPQDALRVAPFDVNAASEGDAGDAVEEKRAQPPRKAVPDDHTGRQPHLQFAAMRRMIVPLLTLIAATAFGQQQDFSKVEIKVQKVAGTVYMLQGAGGNS